MCICMNIVPEPCIVIFLLFCNLDCAFERRQGYGLKIAVVSVRCALYSQL